MNGTATLVISAEGRSHRLELALDQGRRYRAIVEQPGLKAQLVRELALAAPVGVVSDEGGFIGNLKVWENLVLPLAYAGGSAFQSAGNGALEALESRSEALFRELGVLRARFAEICALLPERLSGFERRLVSFVRAMLMEPGIMVYDGLFDGLSRSESERAAGFDRIFRRHFPSRTALYIEAEEGRGPVAETDATFRL